MALAFEVSFTGTIDEQVNTVFRSIGHNGDGVI